MFLPIFLLSILVTVSTERQFYDIEQAEELFAEFIETYDRQYDAEERLNRFEIFKENLKEINRLNAFEEAIFGITEFSDLSPEEISKSFGFQAPEVNLTGSCQPLYGDELGSFEAPETLDYRQEGAVTEVKDQGRCQTCWIFSSIGTIEGAHAIKHGKLVSLSEQQLMNCLRCSGGCNVGGFMTDALSELAGKGVMKESDYPYTQIDTLCRLETANTVVKVAGCYNYVLRTEKQLQEYLFRNGPISLALNGNAIAHYHGGVFGARSCPAAGVNHAVLLVGYGTERGQDYWIIKNSYGKTFGEQGYLRISRGQNTCGIMNEFTASAIVE